MCRSDYFEFVPPPRARNQADYVLVCPMLREREEKQIKAHAEAARLRRENERLLRILENVGRLSSST